jgi:integrase
VRAALNWSVKRKEIAWNPGTNVEVSPEPPAKIVGPDAEEIPAILRGAQPDEFATFMRIALATGHRREDVLRLRLVDIRKDDGALVFAERVVLQKKASVLTANRRKILAAPVRGAGRGPEGWRRQSAKSFGPPPAPK